MEKAVAYCQALVQAKSYSGEEQAMANTLKKIFEENNFANIVIDDYGNITAEIEGNEPGLTLLMDGHMDTVDVSDPEQWDVDPFGGILQDNKVYGRGATDMKGALAAMVAAAVEFRETTKGNFKGKLVISGTVHEECFEGVASKMVADRIQPDFVVIGEASELNIAYGQRGRAEIVVETMGKQAHSSHPESGVNAIKHMMPLLSEIHALEQKSNEHLGNSILEVTDIVSSPYPGASVIPDKCRVTFDRRTLVGETEESVLEEIDKIIQKYIEKHPVVNAKTYIAQGEAQCYTGNTIKGERFFPAWLFEPEDEQIKSVVEAVKDAGINTKLQTYSFCTNGSYFAGRAGIKSIGFGPSRETLAHVANEYIEIEQLKQAQKGYVAISKALLC